MLGTQFTIEYIKIKIWCLFWRFTNDFCVLELIACCVLLAWWKFIICLSKIICLPDGIQIPTLSKVYFISDEILLWIVIWLMFFIWKIWSEINWCSRVREHQLHIIHLKVLCLLSFCVVCRWKFMRIFDWFEMKNLKICVSSKECWFYWILRLLLVETRATFVFLCNLYILLNSFILLVICCVMMVISRTRCRSQFWIFCASLLVGFCDWIWNFKVDMWVEQIGCIFHTRHKETM